MKTHMFAPSLVGELLCVSFISAAVYENKVSVPEIFAMLQTHSKVGRFLQCCRLTIGWADFWMQVLLIRIHIVMELKLKKIIFLSPGVFFVNWIFVCDNNCHTLKKTIVYFLSIFYRKVIFFFKIKGEMAKHWFFEKIAQKYSTKIWGRGGVFDFF